MPVLVNLREFGVDGEVWYRLTSQIDVETQAPETQGCEASQGAVDRQRLAAFPCESPGYGKPWW